MILWFFLSRRGQKVSFSGQAELELIEEPYDTRVTCTVLKSSFNKIQKLTLTKTFSVAADLIVKVLPSLSDREKQAFSYYRNGMSAQAEGLYSTALKNYYQALRLETDPYDRSYILYNIGLLLTNTGEHDRALEYYHQALERNPALPQALNNIAVIYHYRAEQMLQFNRPDLAEFLFNKAEDYWKIALRLAPLNYLEVQGWLKMRANK